MTGSSGKTTVKEMLAAILAEGLASILPEAALVGEEAVAAEPSLVGRLFDVRV